jgi:hypothetical protein
MRVAPPQLPPPLLLVLMLLLALTTPEELAPLDWRVSDPDPPALPLLLLTFGSASTRRNDSGATKASPAPPLSPPTADFSLNGEYAKRLG